MAKDVLKDTLDKIENWGSKKDVPIFYGEIEENRATEVNWIQSDHSDWEKYLSILKSTESNLIFGWTLPVTIWVSLVFHSISIKAIVP